MPATARPTLPTLVRTAAGMALLCLIAPAQAQRGVMLDGGAMVVDPAAMLGSMGGMGGMGMGGPSMSVARMTDNELACEQIYAEAGVLEKTVAAAPPPPDFMRMAMESQSGSMAVSQVGSVASSLLSLVPGVGAVAGTLVSSATSLAATPSMSGMADAMQQYQQSAMAAAYAQGRHAHLTQLFLTNNCKVSALDRAAVDRATAALQPR